MTSIRDAILTGATRLGAAGIENPRRESRRLLAHALGATQADLLRDFEAAVDGSAFQSLLQRRCAREPLAHILGHREFWSLDFLVSPDTLVPRPESETLIEAARAAFAERNPPDRILDLGTGTGCLVLAACTEFPGAFGVGVDLVPQVAALAAANATRLGLADRTAFLAGRWVDALNGQFDLVLCNPPYIPTSEIGGLMPEVARYEPRAALDGGPDGLHAYRVLPSILSQALSPCGLAVIELGAGQAGPAVRLAEEAGFSATTRPDLSGTERALVLRLRKKAFGMWGRAV